jgi:ketosteroid isomerase-like protein
MTRRFPVGLAILLASVSAVSAQSAKSMASAPPTPSLNKQVADEVIALTRAHWAAEMKKDASAWGKNVADDYTVFEGAYPTRIDGKVTMQHVVDGNFSGTDTLITAEMANEKVQVYGDVAILSYNYIASIKNKDGKVTPAMAKSTRVYVKQGGQWMLVHANFAPVTAPN